MSKASILTTTRNTRDLGNHAASDGRRTICGRIYRSDRQDHLSRDDIALLLSKRITTVIDLRTAAEVQARPSAFFGLEGFVYLHFPLEDGSVIPESVEAVSRSYMAIACDPNLPRILEAIGSAEAGVMYNCSAGKDRTGVVTAILLMLCGVSEAEIVADYMVTKACLKETFDIIRTHVPEINMEIVIPRESFMRDFLQLFKIRFGDADGYLKQIGVLEMTKSRIVRKLLKD